MQDVELDAKQEIVRVTVVAREGARFACPDCQAESPRHDHRRREWRHLDTCQFRTILVADVPRVRCATHGTKQILAPWAEPGSGFTALFEALVIDWLKEASILAVARRMGLTWDQASGIQERAVARELMEFVEQRRRRHEARLEAVLDRLVGERDLEVRLPTSGLAEQDRRASFGDQLGAEEAAQGLASHRRLGGGVELLDGLDERELRLLRGALHARLRAMRELLGHPTGEVLAVGPLGRLGFLLRLGVQAQDRRQMQPPQTGLEIVLMVTLRHRRTSTSLAT
ncbi:MAG: transposase family protein [Planctomycetes bacterium]|nr:transposase family protein [Planctomycetota bacterium]